MGNISSSFFQRVRLVGSFIPSSCSLSTSELVLHFELAGRSMKTGSQRPGCGPTFRCRRCSHFGTARMVVGVSFGAALGVPSLFEWEAFVHLRIQEIFHQQ
jgi:hypothetical protein